MLFSKRYQRYLRLCKTLHVFMVFSECHSDIVYVDIPQWNYFWLWKWIK